jgi:hypothetical protein
MNRSRMGVYGAILLLMAAFVLLPVVPYSVPNQQLAFVGAKATATVSPVYVVTQCGVVYNPVIGTTLGKVSVQSPVWSGARWTCGADWAQIPSQS